MARLSSIDGGFLLTESQHSPKHVAGLMVFELPKGQGSAWLRTLLDQMRRVPPGFPFDHRLKSPNALQFELVPDERFEIDYHVRHTVLPRPGSDAQLLEVLGRIHANLLDRDRPLWEFHLVEGIAGRRFAFYVKIHHSICDGITFGRWVDDASTTRPEPRRVRPIWERDEEPPEDARDDVDYLQMLRDGVDALGGGLRTALGMSRITARMIQRRFFDRDGRIALPLSAPRTSLNVPTGAARCIAFTSYPLDDLRAVGHARGGTINDVVMTMCDMALNRYFEDHGERPAGPLVAYMPVNIRAEAGDEDGNLITLLQVKLASRHDDALESFDEVRESIRCAREVFSGAGRNAVQYYSLVVALMSLFEETLKLDRVLPPVNNLVISNVPGSPVKRYFKGAEAVAIYPISTLPPMTALNVTACSYAGTLYFGLVSARSIVPDLPRLAACLDDAFATLAAATGVAVGAPGSGEGKASPKRTAPAPRASKKQAPKKKVLKKKALKKKARKAAPSTAPKTAPGAPAGGAPGKKALKKKALKKKASRRPKPTAT